MGVNMRGTRDRKVNAINFPLQYNQFNKFYQIVNLPTSESLGSFVSVVTGVARVTLETGAPAEASLTSCS